MFDLSKDVASYTGIPPYASELYGVYQPLLGWQSALTKAWVRRGSAAIDQRVRSILDGRIVPGPAGFADPDFQRVDPLLPGSGKSPWRVMIMRNLHSSVLEAVRDRVQAWVDSHGGALPTGAEWNAVISFTDLADTVLPAVNDTIRAEVFADVPTPDAVERAKEEFLARMRYESQLAALITFHAEGQGEFQPDALANLFGVRTAPSLSELLRSIDPLESIDPSQTGGALSPIGLVHTFRQWFFDLGTFLGEPVEHVWLAPGTTIELVEVSTRRQLVEQLTETLVESTSRAEHAETSREELSTAVKDENSSSTKLGVTSSGSVNYGVAQGTVTASFGTESTRRSAREQTNRASKEQSEKLATEIRNSAKSLFRTVTETTDTRSKRYVLQNSSDKLVNYELRRKMRRVGVQLQDLGTRLCWQVFVDEPGTQIGLSELVHFATSPDLSSLKMPDAPPDLPPVVKRVTLPLPFKPILDYTNTSHRLDYEFFDPKLGHIAHIWGDEDDDDTQVICEFRGFRFDPPDGYEMDVHDLRIIGAQNNATAVHRTVENATAKGGFDLIMQTLHFNGQAQINLDVDLVFLPTLAAKDKAAKRYADAKAAYDAEREQKLREAFMDTVRKRIDAAAGMKRRPSWDLREEERTVVYRRLVERLMLDTWKLPVGPERARIGHLRSEIIRSIFDVDEMMYFVAPEWWMPRARTQLQVRPDTRRNLSDTDVVSWPRGAPKRDDNYLVTETSAPARLGSSLGWLMQLDGDNLRNAFLNAPWVKAVVPVRPGREREALNWIRALESHPEDGWDLPYAGEDDPDFVGKTIGEVLMIMADRLESEHRARNGVLASDEVFEHGFDPLAKGFDPGAPAGSRFAQWLTILPTDQIVATEYAPSTIEQP